jgi:hypothetical protein
MPRASALSRPYFRGLGKIEPRERAIILPACNFLETARAKTEARLTK